MSFQKNEGVSTTTTGSKRNKKLQISSTRSEILKANKKWLTSIVLISESEKTIMFMMLDRIPNRLIGRLA